jgi:hypothetical protein
MHGYRACLHRPILQFSILNPDHEPSSHLHHLTDIVPAGQSEGELLAHVVAVRVEREIGVVILP